VESDNDVACVPLLLLLELRFVPVGMLLDLFRLDAELFSRSFDVVDWERISLTKAFLCAFLDIILDDACIIRIAELEYWPELESTFVVVSLLDGSLLMLFICVLLRYRLASATFLF
jgi:hypothetical protein